MILLDTNVISEVTRIGANPAVLAYVNGLPPDSIFTAAICEAEIMYGVSRLPAGRRRDLLMAQMTTFFAQALRDQVLDFDRACAALYGEIRAAREAAGRPISVQDAMIAATARAFGMSAIATRNTGDFENCGVALVDPWRVA
jgi:predicted nucleic acid-binding protein